MISRIRRRAFTLAELLVVIGIIALLIALLLPALSNSRKQAKAVACMSNLRSLNQAFAAYVAENRQRSITYQRQGSLRGDWAEALRPYYRNDAVRLCPEATYKNGYVFPGYGTANEAWRMFSHFFSDGELGEDFIYGSYGFNSFLYHPNDHYPIGHNLPEPLCYFWPYGNEEMQLASHLTPTAREPSRIPVFADSVWFNASPYPFDPDPQDLYHPTSIDAIGMWLFAIDRHGRKVNVAFLDGHVEPVAIQDLWTLKWGGLHGHPDHPQLAFRRDVKLP